MLEADGFAAALDSALVMPFAGASKTGLEQVVTDQCRKSLGQFSLRTNDALDRGAQIIVSQALRNTAEEGEGANMSIEE